MSILRVKKPHWPPPAHPGKSSVVQEEPLTTRRAWWSRPGATPLHPAVPPPPCGPHQAQGGPLRTGSNPASWVVLRAPGCRPSHKPKAERSGQLGETGPPRTLCPGGHIRPQVPGLGGEARSPETWMVCCLSSPGLPARVPGPPSPPSPRVKPILPNPEGRQAGLCFSEPNTLKWTDSTQ